jgi:hypothetical protein
MMMFWVPIFTVLTMAGAFSVTWAGTAQAQTASCHIGKPSYCGKYGGTICEKTNSKVACAKWTAACGKCHATIPSCLGNKRPPASSAQCTSCSAKWSACMKTIDKRFWPTRQSLN